MENDEIEEKKMKDEPTPKCLENRVSIKRAMLSSAESVCETLNDNLAEGDPYELTLLTSSGIVRGTPASQEEYEIKDALTQTGEKQYKINVFSLGYYRNAMLNSFQEKEPDLKAIDCGSYICLKNATVLSNGATYHFAELIVFADQVSGVSMGRLKS